MIRKSLIILGVGILINACDNKNSKVVNDLTLHYLNNNIYDVVHCGSEIINEINYVLCYPVSMDLNRSEAKEMGALYKITYDELDKYTIFAVNGKAKSDSLKGEIPIAEDLYDTSIDIEIIKKKF